MLKDLFSIEELPNGGEYVGDGGGDMHGEHYGSLSRRVQRTNKEA